jgi:putative transposase
MRDELLSETLFFRLDQARSKLAAWAADYNLQRPHSSLRYLTPVAFAANLTATGDPLRNPNKIRRSPLAAHAQPSEKSAEALSAAG